METRVASRHSLRQPAQLWLEIEQGSGGDGQHDGQIGLFIPDQCAQCVTEQQGCNRRGAGVLLISIVIEISGDDHGAHDEQASNQQPGRIEFA